MTTVILPNEAHNAFFLPLQHPGTGQPALFLVNDKNVWEITAVNGENDDTAEGQTLASFQARSLLLSSGHVISDATIHVASPVNTIFFVLDALYKRKPQFLTIDDLYDDIEAQCPEGCKPIPYEIVKNCNFDCCCDTRPGEDEDRPGNSYVRFSPEKFNRFMDAIVARLSAPNALPNGIKSRLVDKPLAPIDISQNTPEHILKLGVEQLAVGLVSSYLSPQLQQAYGSTKDYSSLEEYRAEIDKQRQMAIQSQQALEQPVAAGKRKSSGQSSTSQKGTKTRKLTGQKTSVTNNKTITSFFKKK